jgi:hypothetical protein
MRGGARLARRGIGGNAGPAAAETWDRGPRGASGRSLTTQFEPGSFTNPHYLVRRLRRKLPKATIVGGFWTLKADEADERDALAKTGADLIATFLQQAVAQVTAAARESADTHRATRPSVLEPVSAAS